jgi:uncharacterized membrane protein YkgB
MNPKITILLLRISFGLIYLWFGMLKFFPGLSPAESLAGETIQAMTFGVIPAVLGVKLLAVMECAIGLGFLINTWFRRVILVMIAHMVCTFATFVFLPEQMFHVAPFGLTLTGQYVVKNLIFLGAGILIINFLDKETSVQGEVRTA